MLHGSKTRACLLALLGALAALALAPATGHAQAPDCTITWDGQLGDNTWHSVNPGSSGGSDDDITNWTDEDTVPGDRLPNSGDTVCITSGTPVIQDGGAAFSDSYFIGAGATLTLNGASPPVGANPVGTNLHADKDSTNAGTINIIGPSGVEHADGDTGPDAEGLTNTGTINFAAGGSAGLRAIFGNLLNQGTINVNHPDASIQKFAFGGEPPGVAHTNQGTINISAGNALRVLDSAPFIHGNGSVITGGGTMNFGAGRFEVSGNSQIGASTDVNMNASATVAGVASTATGNIDIPAFGGAGVAQVLEGTVPAGITIDIDGAFVNTPPGDVTNAGRININGDNATLNKAYNDPTNPTTQLINTGTIAFTSTPGTAGRFLHGDVLNQGTIVVDHPVANFQHAGGGGDPPSKLTNAGTLTVQDAGDALRICCGVRQVVQATGGTINGSGHVNIGDPASVLEVQGGSQIAAATDVNLSGADLTFNSAATATGSLDVDFGAGNPTILSGSVPAGYTLDVTDALVRSNASFTNAGQINLAAVSQAFSVVTRLSTEDGNQATTETLTNAGTITTSGTSHQILLSGDFVNQGQLTVSNPDTRIEALHESRPPKLSNAASGTITVQAGGVLQSAPGTAQGYENAGTVNVAGRLSPDNYTQTGGTTTLTASGATHTLGLQPPGGTVAIQGGTLRGTGIINNAHVQNTGGTVAPGGSPGILNVNDNYTQGSGGTLATEISGTAPGTGYDRLAVSGTASLAGTLSITTPGFTPSPGQTFQVLTAGTRTGTFDTVTGGSRFDVQYNPTDVTLAVRDADGDGVADSQDQCPTVAGDPPSGCPPAGGGSGSGSGGGGQGSAPGASTPGPSTTSPSRDTRPARLRLGWPPRASRVVRSRRLIFLFRSDEAVKGTFSATISVPGSSRIFRVRAVTLSVPANRRVTVKLAPSRRQLRAISRALSARRRVRARVRVRAVDPAGNRTRASRLIRIRR